MRFIALGLIAWAALGQTPAAQVGAVLDNWHQAAAVADEARYFAHFAPDGVFMGTDSTERWTVTAFRVWAKPYFDKKKAWSFQPRDRHARFRQTARQHGSMKCWTRRIWACAAARVC